MNTNIVQWAAPERHISTIQVLPIAVKESRRNPGVLIGVFAAILLASLMLALLLPKKYTSSTTVLVDESSYIQPLVKSRTNPPQDVDHAAVAREIAMSRKVMNDLLKTGGWLDGHPDALEQERLIGQIVAHMDISNSRQNPNLVRISYSDSSPQRAYAVTRRLGELIIQESSEAKERLSSQAYRFMDAQVNQYHRKLIEAEAKLVAYRKANPDARPGMSEDVSRRIGELRRAVDSSRMDLIDSRALAGATHAQLSSQGPMQSRSNQIRARLAQLQSQRDTLLLNDTELHPDVIRITHQMQDLEAELRNPSSSSSSLGITSDTAFAAATPNPQYSALSNRLTEARGRSAGSASRVAMGQQLLNQALADSDRIADAEAGLAELTTDSAANHDIYQDLLKRREDAHVAMNLDAQRLGYSIQEPAAVPLQPSGLRPIHVMGMGLILAVVVPMLLLFGWLKIDQRVRLSSQIEQYAGLPVLVSIPARQGRRRRGRSFGRMSVASLLSSSMHGHSSHD